MLTKITDTETRGLRTPQRIAGSVQPLKIDSTLTELAHYRFCVSADCLGCEVATVFERYPDISGVVINEGNEFLGVIARQDLLEYLLRPQGIELFLQRPIRVLYSYIRSQPLVLSATTTIISAAQQALRRSPDTHSHPIVIQTQDDYCLLNSHDLNIAYWQLRGIETQVRYERTQAKILQSDKMASLGRLVDGVAHEILEPIGFIWGNLSYITEYSQQLLTMIEAYEQAMSTKPAHIEELEDDIELEYLKDDFPRIIKSVQRGAARLKHLGTSLQNFCHLDEVYPKPADLNEMLSSVVLLLKSHLTTKIVISCDYGDLPPVSCFVGQLSQVMMNILSDTVDRLLEHTIRHRLAEEIDDSTVQLIDVEQMEVPEITITTHVIEYSQDLEGAISDRWVTITMTDNGPGLPAELEPRVTSGFVESMGAMRESSLAMSYRIIKAKHGGSLNVRSRTFSQHRPLSDASTEFEIVLPLYTDPT